MSTKVGRRIYANEHGVLSLAEGDYGFDPRINKWEVRPPGVHAGTLHEHTVVEHEDRTITVTPSILLEGFGGVGVLWHGWLEHGIWRREE